MALLTVVVGMAGSGKSTYCQQICRQSGSTLFEDATFTRTDERRAGFECLGELVARLVGRNEDCVMDESHLTLPDFRDSFQRFCQQFLPHVNQKWVFFEKNVLACINNVYHDWREDRDKPNRLIALNNQRQVYSVPDPSELPGFEVIPVRQVAPHFTVETKAIAWLESQARRKDSRSWWI